MSLFIYLLLICALCTVTMEFTGKASKILRHLKVCAKLHQSFFMLTKTGWYSLWRLNRCFLQYTYLNQCQQHFTYSKTKLLLLLLSLYEQEELFCKLQGCPFCFPSAIFLGRGAAVLGWGYGLKLSLSSANWAELVIAMILSLVKFSLKYQLN